MSEKYTTGELAKMCNVSVRTVQYYDKEDILKPSEISEGGRRLYTEEDFKKLKYICLYKSFGFSLSDIKTIINSENMEWELANIIIQQKEKIENDMRALQNTKEHLAIILQEIEENGDVKIQSIEELHVLIVKKKEHRKTDVMTYIFLASYVLILLMMFPVTVSLGGIAPYIMIGVAIILMVGLVYYHSIANAYVCPKCHHKFTVSLLKDLVSFNDIKKGKFLKCPSCKYKGWMKETYL